jgi:hypothetical protein
MIGTGSVRRILLVRIRQLDIWIPVVFCRPDQVSRPANLTFRGLECGRAIVDLGRLLEVNNIFPRS